MQLLSELKRIDILSDLPEAQLEWLIENSNKRIIEAGGTLFRKDDPIDAMHIILDGQIVFKIEQLFQRSSFMKQIKFLILLAVVSLFVCAQILAGSSQEQKQNQLDINQSKKAFRNSVVTFNNLSLAIDFWHDANLKGDRKASDEHMQMICQIIDDDIKGSFFEHRG